MASCFKRNKRNYSARVEKKRLILGSCIPPEGAPIRLQLGNTDPLSALVLAYTKTIYLIGINQTTFSILTKQSK